MLNLPYSQMTYPIVLLDPNPDEPKPMKPMRGLQTSQVRVIDQANSSDEKHRNAGSISASSNRGTLQSVHCFYEA